MWIKICANTNLADAQLAAELGADALGFVFAPSKRQVTPLQVATIVAKLPPHVEKIGVFTTHDAFEIVGFMRTAGLTGVQLHSNFNAALVRQLVAELGEQTPIIQTIHWNIDDVLNESFAAEIQAINADESISRILVDSKTHNAIGGSGLTFQWSAAAQVLSQSRKPIIVAGGLRAENVTHAVEALSPWGVDVASGVESEPGKKDRSRLQEFIEKSRSGSRVSQLGDSD